MKDGGQRTVSGRVLVERAWQDVARPLRAEPWRLMAAATGSPTGRLHVRMAGFDIGRDVRLVLGRPQFQEHEARLSMDWEARTRSAFFPTMRAELRLRPVAGELTELTLVGRYRVPLGPVGWLADRLVGRRVASAAVDGLLHDLARELDLERRP